MRAIAYFRIRHSDPKASGHTILEQRNIVAAWAASHADHEVIAEYTEDETDLGPRHILKMAIEECREQDAFLLIASTEAIGHGQPFYPRIFSVPVIKLPPPRRALGYIRATPAEAPASLSLYFDGHAAERMCDIYLCNGSADGMEGVTVSLVGATASLDDLSPTINLSDDGVLITSTETRRVECLPAKHMSLISNYDVIFDGDFLLICDLIYRAEGCSETKARAIVDKGHNGCGFVRFGYPEKAKAIADVTQSLARIDQKSS